MLVIINGRKMAAPERAWRTIMLLLISICLSVAIGLAILITALAPASVAAPSKTQSAPRHACTVAALWPVHLTTGAMCPVTTLSPKCCARPSLG
jgi:hypothetical protein